MLGLKIELEVEIGHFELLLKAGYQIFIFCKNMAKTGFGHQTGQNAQNGYLRVLNYSVGAKNWSGGQNW